MIFENSSDCKTNMASIDHIKFAIEFIPFSTYFVMLNLRSRKQKARVVVYEGVIKNKPLTKRQPYRNQQNTMMFSRRKSESAYWSNPTTNGSS